MRKTFRSIIRKSQLSTLFDPMWLLTCFMLVTTSVLVWLAWASWSSYRHSEATRLRDVRLTELRGTILHLDEVLTMSARMAAASGSLQWEARYDRFEPALAEAIAEAIRLAPESGAAEAAASTDAANTALVEMERKAFALVRQGRLDEARAVLFSDAYEAQKIAYARGMEDFRRILDNTVTSRLQERQRDARRHVLIAVAALPFTIGVWFLLFRATQRWKTAICEQNARLADQQGQLQQLNQELAERAVASEDKYRRLYESSRDAIMTATPEEGFLAGNRAALELFGCRDEAELASYTPADLSPEHQPDGSLSSVKAQEVMAVALEKGSNFFEWKHKRRDGNEFFADVLLTPVELDGKKVLQATVRDITARKQAEEALGEKDQQLQQKHKMEALGALAGGIAHEFNNLLQAIRGHASFAMEELPPCDQSYQDLQQVLQASDRAATLTRQLLNFSRCDSLQCRTVSPNQAVHDVVEMVRPLIGEHIDIQTILDEGAGAIHADPTMLQQVLMNLCINARDAMPSGGTLSIRTEDITLAQRYADSHPDVRPGRYVRIAVTDTGCGMTSEVKERIFEPFFTTKEVGKGTGMGLAMVYGVVQQHGGTINVYSEPGAGTTFRLYLPTTEEPSMNEGCPTRVPVRGGNETILVAEDEPLVRDIAIRTLRRAGYCTLAAADGEEAIALAEQHGDEIALALLDLVMPKMGGREVCRQLETLLPGLSVVFCTGYDPAADQTDFIRQNGLTLIEKPFTSETLLRRVREALDANGGQLLATLAADVEEPVEVNCMV